MISDRSKKNAAALSDGEWHRLHPASPFLKGGFALLAVIGYFIAQARERLIEVFVPEAGYGGEDPVEFLFVSGVLGWALLIFFGFLLIFMMLFYISWRMHTFRITAEVVEVRSGVIFRTNRRARLDRIQGVNIARPLFARLFGAARLEINQAGNDANVKLEYLASTATDELRREILRLASGTRSTAAVQASTENPDQRGIVGRRVDEFLAPELAPDIAEPASVVKLSVGRLIGSILLSTSTFVLLGITVVVIVVSLFAREAQYGLLGFIPAVLGFGGVYLRRFTKSLRYTVAGTPDGVRVGFGLLSTTNETLPPGRIHSIAITQSIFWRPFGWWEVRVNRAGQSATHGSAGQQNTTILPVGNQAEVLRVLALMLPALAEPATDSIRLIEQGLVSHPGPDDPFTTSPPRARPLRWFSRRRNGFAFAPEAVLLRRGAIWRSLVIVPQARVQSVSVRQGPLLRALRLASIHLHTVAGPIVAQLGALDHDDALEFFAAAENAAIVAASGDTSHRWRSIQESP